MTNTRSNRYQEGTIERVKRAKGPDVWVYRWRETQADGSRVQRKKTIGTVKELPKRDDVKREVESLRSEINAQQQRVDKKTIADAWGHFQLNELDDTDRRSETTISRYQELFVKNILPKWGDVALDDVKTLKVEEWLKSLTCANATKAKFRAVLCLLFNHAIRSELTDRNPISGTARGAGVRQSSLRSREPDILTLAEMRAIIHGIRNEAIRTMTLVAASTAMRRSEILGLKWKDLEFDKRWFGLKQGVVHNMRLPLKDRKPGERRSRPSITRLKTPASRKGVPMTEDLAAVLLAWRDQTPYPAGDDWVFASPNTNGEWPYNPTAAIRYWVQSAAKKEGIDKRIGWHTFRHSVASLLSQSGENVKVVQELLRHASSRITQDVYQQADQSAKREALKKFSSLFVVPDTKSA